VSLLSVLKRIATHIVMAGFIPATHAGFDPAAATQAPSDSGLQNAIATSWHP